ncbi:MAG TPA: hypothetical protein VEI97_10785, partial [bacterium]|nr:hypothetical protein [bacterium]
LGKTALQVLWPDGPTTISKARTRPVNMGDYWLISTYHPSMHTSGRQDLVDEYLRVFETTARLITGEYAEINPTIWFVRDGNDYARALRQLQQAKRVVFDLETNIPKGAKKNFPERSTFWMPTADIVCAAFATSPDKPVWVFPRKYLDTQVSAALYRKPLIGHNIKYDLVAWAHFIDPDLLYWCQPEDTMLMMATQDQGKVGNSLETLTSTLLGAPDWKNEAWRAVEEENERRRKARQKQNASLADIPLQVTGAMCARDVFATLRLYDFILRNREVPKVYKRLMIPALKALSRLELTGLGVDQKYYGALSKATAKHVENLKARMELVPEIRSVAETTGQPFNFNSLPQQYVLLDETRLEVRDRTPTGNPKLSKDILALLAKKHRAWALVDGAKKNSNLISKFLDPLRYH